MSSLTSMRRLRNNVKHRLDIKSTIQDLLNFRNEKQILSIPITEYRKEHLLNFWFQIFDSKTIRNLLCVKNHKFIHKVFNNIFSYLYWNKFSEHTGFTILCQDFIIRYYDVNINPEFIWINGFRFMNTVHPLFIGIRPVLKEIIYLLKKIILSTRFSTICEISSEFGSLFFGFCIFQILRYL